MNFSVLGGLTSTGEGYPTGTKIYIALLTQSGTSAPVATVLQNTLGGAVVWARTGVGVYTATLTGVFTVSKTFFPTQTGFSGGVDEATKFGLVRTSSDVVTLSTVDAAIDPADSALNNCPIQILVFP